MRPSIDIRVVPLHLPGNCTTQNLAIKDHTVGNAMKGKKAWAGHEMDSIFEPHHNNVNLKALELIKRLNPISKRIITYSYCYMPCGVGHITKNSTNVFSACRKRRLKETGRGDWESPPL